MACELSVQDLFRRAVHQDDESAMREAVIRLLGRDTRYYTQKSEPPAWRAPWVERI